MNLINILKKLLIKRQPSREALIEELQNRIGYFFKDVNLLEHALTHRSFVYENNLHGIDSNERMEFLGDAVLGLAIGHLLVIKYPEMHEGSLSKLRACLVSESGLASMARDIELGKFIFLGKGEILSKGQEKSSILADTFEAVMAAFTLMPDLTPHANLLKNFFIPCWKP